MMAFGKPEVLPMYIENVGQLMLFLMRVISNSSFEGCEDCLEK